MIRIYNRILKETDNDKDNELITDLYMDTVEIWEDTDEEYERMVASTNKIRQTIAIHRFFDYCRDNNIEINAQEFREKLDALKTLL